MSLPVDMGANKRNQNQQTAIHKNKKKIDSTLVSYKIGLIASRKIAYPVNGQAIFIVFFLTYGKACRHKLQVSLKGGLGEHLKKYKRLG